MTKIYSTLQLPFLLATLILCSLKTIGQTVVTYTYTGATQTFVIPPCVTSISVDARGAAGGAGGKFTSSTGAGGAAGNGGRVQAVLGVTSGATLYINVGGTGVAGNNTTGGAGGFNGGGTGRNSTGSGGSGGGGGASDLRVSGTALSNRMIVASGGGGGGGSGSASSLGGDGGHGGGTTGTSGANGSSTYGVGGGGGTASAGGALGGTSAGVTAGAVGVGGDGSGILSNGSGGGGGGGYYGGGGGGTNLCSGCTTSSGGGGGGSSYTDPSATSVVHTAGYQTGSGSIIISYNFNGAGLSASASSNSICAGSTVTLTASNVNSYTWTPGGSNATSLTVNPTSNTSYTVEGTNSLGCVSKAVLTVTVDAAAPTLTVTNTALSGGICPFSTVILTASGATSYTWTGGSIAVTNGVPFGPTTPATYIVTGGNACGTTTAAASVSVHPLPNVSASPSSPSLCAGSSLTLTGVGNATNYVWLGGTPTITNGIGFIPSTGVNYTVIGTSALSCTAAATVSVPVYPAPIVPPTAQPTLICVGNSATLTATGAAGYTWTGGPTAGNSGTYVVTPTSPGVSTYTVLRANSTCTTSQQISVTTNSLPTIIAVVSGPTLICASSSASLAAAGGLTYTWTSPGNPPITPSFTFTGSSPVVFPPVNTTYTVAAHDGTCINTAMVSVGINPIPSLTVTASSSVICAGQTVSLSVAGGNNYTWTASSLAASLTTSSFTDAPTAPAAYNVTGDNAFGCTATSGQIVLVNASPILTVGVALNKTLTCNGGAATLNASGADTYTWSSGQQVSSAAVTPTNVSSGPVVYTVSGTNTLTQCSSSKTISVNVFIPALSISGNTITCPGGPITLTASGGSSNYNWQMPGNSSGFAILNTTLSAAAIFTVSASTSSAGVSCPGSKTIAVDVYPLPPITAVAQRTTICNKESVVLTASGGTAYVWSNNLAQTATISVSPSTNTNYTVTGTDVNGCANTGTVSVKVQGCLGIGELGAQNGLSIYPNPNSGEFFIQSTSDAKLTLVNELGQIVRTFILNGPNNFKVQVSDVSQGVYFLSGEKDGSPVNARIIVAK